MSRSTASRVMFALAAFAIMMSLTAGALSFFLLTREGGATVLCSLEAQFPEGERQIVMTSVRGEVEAAPIRAVCTGRTVDNRELKAVITNWPGTFLTYGGAMAGTGLLVAGIAFAPKSRRSNP